MEGLLGKWVIIRDVTDFVCPECKLVDSKKGTNDFYLDGQVMAAVGISHVLIKLRPYDDPVETFELYSLFELNSADRESRHSIFFNTEKEMDIWLERMNAIARK